MKVPVNSYKIVCDGCGQIFENGEGWVCYVGSPYAIEDDAIDSDWIRTTDEHHYCPDCYSLNDNDIFECKDERRYNVDYEPITQMKNE